MTNNNGDSISWTETKSSGETLRIGRDAKGRKRFEHRLDKDGRKFHWRYRESEKLEYFEEFSPSGVMTVTRSFDENGTESEYRGFSETGVLLNRAIYDDRGVATKRFKWNENGLLLEEAEYLNNYKHGTVSKFSSVTGRLISKIEYREDRFDGLSEVYFETPYRETIKARATYKNGQIEGDFAVYYDNGNLEERGTIRDGKRDGEHVRFHQNGRVRSITRYRDGEMNGNMEDFREDGSISRRYPTRNGKAHGIEEYFNPQGQLTSRSAHVDGVFTKDFSQFESGVDKAGTVETFYENGSIRERETFQNGVRNGPYEYFYHDGKTREKGRYENDRPCGPIERFNREGKPFEVVCYKNGLKDGPTSYYFESGEISAVLGFKDGYQISARYYYENGQFKSTSEFDENDLGVWRKYSDRGLLTRECQVKTIGENYRYLRHGRDLVYGDDGVLLIEANYVFDVPQGTTRYYWPNGFVQFENDYLDGVIQTATEYTKRGEMRRYSTYYPDGSIKSEEFFDVDESPVADEVPPLEIGMVIGNYKLLRSIGHGGMGDVYLAEEAGLGRRVAIKTIRGEADEAAMSRFLAEGRALAKIKHENVISIYSVGNHFGTPYMAMEYVEGWALNALLGQGLLSLGEQISLFRQIALGIQAAHAETILHRDIKPGNMIISKDFGVKVIDFGIAKILDDTKGYKTAPNVIVGTIKYLAPEIAQGLPASVQTDIYGLGIVLFEMLTGAVPFAGNNRFETLELIKTKPLEFPEGISDILPDALKLMVAKMMAKDVADRHVNIGELLRDLDAISFENLPLEFMAPTPRGIGIANSAELKKRLLEKGHSESEFSLIINLASRIQYRMISDPNKTEPIGAPEELVISPEALSEATERFERAKRDVLDSKSKKP